MKLINSKKAIGKILEDSENIYNFLEEDYRCPCWEIKVDRDRGDLIFLIDAKEIYAYPLKKLKPYDLTIEGLNTYMQIFKTQDLKLLAKELKK